MPTLSSIRRAPGRNGDLVQASLEKLGAHVKALTEGFSLKSSTRLLLAPEHEEFQIEGVRRTKSLDELCQALRQQIASAPLVDSPVTAGGRDG